jgi:outer membrane murein-binding lipoprotein Lpp
MRNIVVLFAAMLAGVRNAGSTGPQGEEEVSTAYGEDGAEADELRGERDELKTRVDELETQLAEAKDAATTAATKAKRLPTRPKDSTMMTGAKSFLPFKAPPTMRTYLRPPHVIRLISNPHSPLPTG